MAADKKNDRLICLFLLGMILFNYPILSLLNRPAMVFGIPLLYFYIFFIWAVWIFFVGIITASGTDYRQIRNEVQQPGTDA